MRVRITGKTMQILLIIIAVILVVASLKSTRVVTVPLAFAFLIAVLVSPLQRWLERYIPRWAGVTVIMLILAAFLGIGVGALILSAEIIEPKAPQYLDRTQEVIQMGLSWLREKGFPVGEEPFANQNSLDQYFGEAIAGIKTLWSVVGLFFLIVFLLTLLLLEAGEYRKKVSLSFSSPADTKIIAAFSRMTGKLRRFLFVQTFTSFLTGILTGIWCLILGVDFAFVWGLVAFVLNFIPTIGSAIAVIPPTFVALIFNGVGTGVATFVGLAVIQLTMGNFVDPRLQGRSLSLSPFVALLSIIFWGWVWGIPGAFIAIPMTISVVVLLEEFEPTKSIALLLGDIDVEEDKGSRGKG